MDDAKMIYKAKKRAIRSHPFDILDFLLHIGIEKTIKKPNAIAYPLILKLTLLKIERGFARDFLEWEK